MLPDVVDKIKKTSAEETLLPTVAVVGLGYVGLPVAVAFARERPTIGYDLSRKRIESLRHHVDATGEVSSAELREALNLESLPQRVSVIDKDATVLKRFIERHA